MFIQTQETPNPLTLKFIPGIEVLKSGIKSYTDAKDAADSMLARNLFNIEGVAGVFFSTDFISVSKAPDYEWSYLKPIILATIMDHFVAGFPAVEESKNAESITDKVHDEITNQIIDILETRVRPAVAQDGGDIIFKDFQNGVVYVELHGACSGCPSSTVTLKNGIENMLRHYIPEVTSVESV